MRKKRVSDGKFYYYITLKDSGFRVSNSRDDCYPEDSDRNFLGNYYYTEEEAEAIAKRLKAVLNGADVIQMPSEFEMGQQAMDIAEKRQDVHYGDCYDSASDMYDWIKSKIIK